jgi:hypothetical protein
MLNVHYFDLGNNGLFMDITRKEGGLGLFYHQQGLKGFGDDIKILGKLDVSEEEICQLFGPKSNVLEREICQMFGPKSNV